MIARPAETPAKSSRPSLQSRFPYLWLATQYLIAGYFHRGRCIRKYFDNSQRVLEVGCSVGIDSGNFAKAAGYLGIDIDATAIALAGRRFRNVASMRFKTADIRELDPAEHQADFILFCGTLHHIPDADAGAVLDHAAKLLAPGGVLVVIDYAMHDDQGWMERAILRLEDGCHLRDREAFMKLLRGVDGCDVTDVEVFKNAAFVFPWPVMAHKFLIRLRKSPSTP